MDRVIHEEGLVLYKGHPARVKSVTDRLLIETQDGDSRKVRPKDVMLLHPGPVAGLATLRESVPSPDVDTAWELLQGEEGVSLAELSELLYGAFTPSTAWAAWALVADGLLFSGTPDCIEAHSESEVNGERERRRARSEEREAWAAFLGRVQERTCDPADDRYIQEVEGLALGRTSASRVLRELGRGENEQTAHALLLELGWWDHTQVPYARRMGLSLTAPEGDPPSRGDEDRRDLTHLTSLAIDDEGNTDPDDAVSVEGSRLWVHVADVAALVPVDGPEDLEARSRAATLYLPEGNVPMLAAPIVRALGLGLDEISPALSFGLDIDDAGNVADVEVTPSWVKTQRLTYAQADERSAEPLFAQLRELTSLIRQRRHSHGAVSLNWPEARVQVEGSRVRITPQIPYASRELVAEAMVTAGEGASLFASDHHIPFPFATQNPPESELVSLEGFAGAFARRRQLRPGRTQGGKGPHWALGLELYSRVTSPLRRYADLVAHQQLRAHLRGDAVLSEAELLERVAATATVGGAVRQTERNTNRHWTLVYLEQNPGWRGEAHVVETRGPRATVVVPDLALETSMFLPQAPPPLNAVLSVRATSVDLARLDVRLEKIG